MLMGLFILSFLFAVFFAIFQVILSDETGVNKLVWTLLILILPVAGLIIWTLNGPRAAPAST